MTAKEKIENLTNSWYTFVVLSAIASIVQSGLGFFTIAVTAISTFFSLAFTWWLGRRLLKRSSLTRALLVLVSGLGLIFGTLGTAKMAWSIFDSFSVSVLVQTAFGAFYVLQVLRSFRTLTSPEVKAYIRG